MHRSFVKSCRFAAAAVALTSAVVGGVCGSPALAAPTAQRILLISIDGLHAIDLKNYVALHPTSTLAVLSDSGVTYAYASCPVPSDAFPGLLALVTGGTPKSTGVYYGDGYDRTLYAPAGRTDLKAVGGGKPGTEVRLDETMEYDSNAVDGGFKGKFGSDGSGGNDAIDPAKLPNANGSGSPIYPHNFLRVNTVFGVVHNAGMYTAWCDLNQAYDAVLGNDRFNKSGSPTVNDLYNPDIHASLDANGEMLYPPAGGTGTARLANTEKYDSLKVNAIINQIHGKFHDGSRRALVPAIFGMNFQSVNVAQTSIGVKGAGGYRDANGDPAGDLSAALDFVDSSLGKIVNAFDARQYASTVIIVTAKHGQCPLDRGHLIKEKGTVNYTLDPASQLRPEVLVQASEDDVALFWLNSPSDTEAAVAALDPHVGDDHIPGFYYGPSMKKLFGDPGKDARIPDIIALAEPGVIWTTAPNIAAHGGFSDDDTHVALLVSAPGMAPITVYSRVSTTQVAPTILSWLGLDPNELQAVKEEHTSVLPALGF